MPRGDRNHRYAIVALGFLLLAVCLLALFDFTARHYANQEIIKYQTAYPKNGDTEDYSPIISSLREFDPREDTYAQWIMATFGIFATFASMWAVWLLFLTLRETRRAVDAAESTARETSRIGQAQVRAYLTCAGGTFITRRDMISLCIRLVNFGQSPAKSCKIVAVLSALRSAEMPKNPLGINSFRTPLNSAGEIIAVPTGTEGAVTYLLKLSMGESRDDIFSAMHELRWNFFADCQIEWIDVFDEVQSLNFYLTLHGDDDFKEVDGVTLRTGKLNAINTAPQQKGIDQK